RMPYAPTQTELSRECFMLDPHLKAQLQQYLQKLVSPVELVAVLDHGDASKEMRALLDDIAQLSNLVSIREENNLPNARIPSFYITRPGESPRICFAGIPMGHEFTSLVLALLQTGGHPPRITEEQIAQIRAI